MLPKLAGVAAMFLGGNATAESFRLQVVTTVINLSEDDLQELARVIVDVVNAEEWGWR